MHFETFSEFEEYHKWEKYRWEFMRRNKEYRRAYKKALKLRASAKKTQPYIFTDEGKKESKLAQEFFVHYGKLIDPDKAWDDMEVLEKSIFSRVIDQRAVMGLWQNPKTPGKVRMEIDFNRINSIDALKRKISDRIDQYVMQYPEYGRKEYYKIFDRFLKVGDLKEKNMTFPEIAKQVFSESDNLKTGIESALKKAQNDYKQYIKYVSGGYRDITFP